MKPVIFSGTSEGRALCEQLSRAGQQAVACVATEYGKQVMPALPGIDVHTGRMDAAQMADFLRGAACAVDATHPYAVEVSKNIRQACAQAGCRYLRLLRPRTRVEGAVHVPDARAAADYLAQVDGAALLTVGSKELHCFTAVPDYAQRLWPRVLPAEASLRICSELGFPAAHLILMQGPFSEEMNCALLRMSGAKWLVTKDTGEAGGLPEKLAAARACGCTVILIDRPQEDGLTPEQVRRMLLPQRPMRFPLFVDLTGRRCLVVGCGKIGAHRAEVLLRYGAEVIVVAPEGEAPAGAVHRRRAFVPDDLDGVFLATAATDSRAVNHEIFTLCTQRGIFISTADNRDECSFFFPAVRTGANLSVGLVSDGSDHKKTARAARAIERMLQEEART
ncbi:MAG TPA: precorrin-6A reductase [Candidatus Butyricicoccus stercorigallinarum]|nr:precorrin-6A reductase [Candidatus Butyricicoccus stercorigallinarum]